MTPCPTEIDHIMVIMEEAFDPAYGEAWNKRQITDALAMPSTHAVLVFAAADQPENGSDSAAPAGFVLSRAAPGEEELLLIGVRPQFRRQGIGKNLLTRFFVAAKARGAEQVFLEMRDGNPAISLYEKAGFQAIGRRREYYRLQNGSRVDAITMGCAV